MISENQKPVPAATEPPPADGTAPAAGRSWSAKVGRALSVKHIGAIYVWILIILVFTVISPGTFFTEQTAKSVLNQYAISGIVALGLVVPLAAGVYDLSIGYTVGLAGVLVAYLLEHTGMSPALCVVVTLIACLGVGLINSFVVVVLGVDSFIGTLGSGAILSSITLAISGGQVLTGEIGSTLKPIATTDLGGITLPVFYMLAIMVGIGFWLARTRAGRFTYAVGYDKETARLAGLPTKRLTTVAFLTSAIVAGFAGVVLAARVSAGDPTAGPSYLIPAFSAAFLGATQFGGRFNPWGTVIGVLLLGTGDVGLVLAGGPSWTPMLFEGVVLIAAVALTTAQRKSVFSQLKLRWKQLRSSTQPA